MVVARIVVEVVLNMDARRSVGHGPIHPTQQVLEIVERNELAVWTILGRLVLIAVELWNASWIGLIVREPMEILLILLGVVVVRETKTKQLERRVDGVGKDEKRLHQKQS